MWITLPACTRHKSDKTGGTIQRGDNLLFPIVFKLPACTRLRHGMTIQKGDHDHS